MFKVAFMDVQFASVEHYNAASFEEIVDIAYELELVAHFDHEFTKNKDGELYMVDEEDRLLYIIRYTDDYNGFDELLKQHNNAVEKLREKILAEIDAINHTLLAMSYDLAFPDDDDSDEREYNEFLLRSYNE